MTDELELLRGFRADLRPAPAANRVAARARLLRAPAPRRRPPRAALALAAVAAAAGAVAVVSGLDDGRVAPASAAARALQRVATVAEHHTGPGVPRDDQYFYVASEGTELSSAYPTSDANDGFSYLYTKRRQIWLSVTRPGLLREKQVGGERWLTPRDRENWIRAGRPKMSGGGADAMAMGAIGHYYLGDEKLSTQQLRDLDPTPRELFDRLRSRVGDRGASPDGEVFVEIADALREAPQTPRLRATFCRALALVPGVQLLGNVKDRLGRDAIGVAFTERTGVRHELLFDPETSEVLNERQVVVKRVQGLTAPVGTAIEDIVYTKRAVTDATTRP
ncbi:MAG TPA: CU044_5270 family protein [Solirubrobacteraceae bacterium]